MTARPLIASALASVRDHFSVDLRTLGLFRIGLAAVILVDLSDRSHQIQAHYTDFGILPRAALRQLDTHQLYSLHSLGGSLGFEAVLFGIAAVAGVAMLLGLYTRLSTIASLVLLISIQNRNPLVNHAGDVLQLALLLWAMFLPLGRCYSLDARKRPLPPGEIRYFSIASVALLLQPLLLYGVAAVSKAQSASWHEGRALHAVLHKASYVRPLGELALDAPTLVRSLTYATLLVEASVVVFLLVTWRRDVFRIAAFSINLGFQVGIWSVVSIGVFQPLAILSVFPYLPGSVWERIPWLRIRVRIREGVAATPDPPPTPPTWLISCRDGLVGVVLLYIIATNLVSVAPDRLAIREPFNRLGRYAMVDQRWRMFANTDETRQGWYVVVGYLADGRSVDALNLRSQVSYDRPSHYASTLPNNNWRIYWSRISGDRVSAFRPYLADYFCRRWNQEPRPDGSIHGVEVIHMNEVDTDPDVEPRSTRVSLVRLRCQVDSAPAS